MQGCAKLAVNDVSELPKLKSSIPVAQDTIMYADLLHGVTSPDFAGEVKMLTGANVPKAHCTLECHISQGEKPNSNGALWVLRRRTGLLKKLMLL